MNLLIGAEGDDPKGQILARGEMTGGEGGKTAEGEVAQRKMECNGLIC